MALSKQSTSNPTQESEAFVEPHLGQPYVSQWTPRRRELLQWFQKEAPSLASAYEAVIEILGMPRMPAKVHLVGHIVRDIYNKLPEILDGQYRHTKSGEVYKGYAKNIEKVWESGASFGIGREHSLDPSLAGTDKVTVSVAAFRSVERLLKKHRELSQQPTSMKVLARALYRRFGESRLNAPRRLVAKFEEERSWFTSRAHLASELAKLPDEEGLAEHFTSLESALYSLVGQYFTGKTEIDVILRLANQRGIPTDEEVEEVVPWLTAPHHERYFFRELQGPGWIAPLKDRDMFQHPPPVEKVAGGGVRCQMWPQSQYLVRMAPHAPEEVAEILANVETDNWAVARDIIQSAKAMPANQAAKLASKIGELVVELKLFYELDDVGAIAADLARGNEEGAALDLVSTAFGMELRDPAARRPREDYGYLEGLRDSVIPALIPVRTRELVHLLVDWLRLAVKAEDDRGAGGDDYSYVWRPAIEDHEQNHDHNFAAKLVTCVREALELAITKNYLPFDNAIQILEEHDSVLLKRLRLHLIAEFADRAPELARETMLNKDLFDDYPYKHEYARLMGMRFQLLDDDQQAKWLSWIDDGPEAFDTKFFDETEDDKLRKHQEEYWKFQRLYWIRDHLTGERAQFYEQMLADKGKPELADLNVYSGEARWGHESPYTAEQLAEMGFEAVVKAVRQWRPASEQRGFDEPTVEGLANSFERYVASDPVRFSSEARLLEGAPAVYVRSFLEAMETAVKERKRIDLPQVLDLCIWAIDRPVDENTASPEEDSPLVERTWQWCRDRIANLIQEVCKAKDDAKRPLYVLEHRKQLWAVINPLANSSTESNVVREDADKDPRVTDWPLLTMNSPCGRGMLAALAYTDWVVDHLVEDRKAHRSFPGGFDRMPEMRDSLDTQLTRTDDDFTVRGGFGWRLGLLYWLDGDWVRTNVDRIFDLSVYNSEPSQAYGWAAWNIYLFSNHPYVELYRILREQYSYAVDQAKVLESTLSSREHPFTRLGEHLIVLYGRGNLGNDPNEAWIADNEIVKRLVTQSHVAVRSHAMEFVGRSLPEDAADVPGGAIDRFIYLWEQYWEAVGQEDAKQNPNSYVFGRWFSCGAFDSAWSIEQLEKFVEAAPKADPDHMIMERLATICGIDPLRSARVVGMMVEGDDEGWRVGGWRKEAKTILSVAMKAGGESKAAAKQVIDRLGRRGFLDFGELLKTTIGGG